MCSNNERPGLPEVKWEKIELTNVRDIGGGVKVGLYNGVPVVIHPAAPVKAKALVVPPHKAGFTLHHNDHYANYWTAEEAITDGQGGWYGDDDNWVSLEEKAKACATNEIWTAQWYPETPIGFCLLHASTLEALNIGLSAVDSTDQP